MTCGRRAGSQLLAVLALLVSASTAGAAPGDGSAAPAPAVVSASTLAAKITSLTTKVAQLEARASELDRQQAAAELQVDGLSSRLDTNVQESSRLVAAAQRQALALYMNTDPAQQTFALAAAVSQGDVNDVSWSLGLVKINSGEILKLARSARKRTKSADAALTEALSTRDRLVDERARLNPLIAQAKLDVKSAEVDLEDYVHRLGPGTINGMTTVAYDAYRVAERLVAIDKPTCGLRWELLAAIGKTESNHALGRLAPNGDTAPPILGIPIGADTDQGVIDTDPKLDHAVGPMQFIPSTWQKWGIDGNNDGIVNINNIYDEAFAAGRYLCAAAGDLTLLTRDGVIKAIWAYNPNEEYLRVVGGRFEALAADVARGWFSSADLPTPGRDDGTRRPVAPPTTPAQTPTTMTLFAPFTATAVASGASPTTAAPAQCGPSAALSGRAGVYRCQVVIPPIAPAAGAQAAGAQAAGAPPAAAQPAAAQPPAAAGAGAADPTQPANGPLLDPCVAAPFDGALLACATDPAQAVTLVRVAAPLAAAVGPAPPYFAIILEGGDRCLPTSTVTAAKTVNASAALPATGTVGRSATIRSASQPRQAGATTTSTTNAPAATTTTKATTTTTAATTTIAATTTTVAVATTKPATTTTAPATTTTTAAPATTTTTAFPAPAGALPAPAAGTPGYKCASGAQIVGQPILGTPSTADPATPTTIAAATTVAKPTTTPATIPGAPAAPAAAAPANWVATVTQAGLASRIVAVAELIS